jgi:hypothetical protein
MTTAAVDVVGVFDANLNQLFADARPIKAMVKPDSKFMDHPGESGITITDHRVFEPVEIELSMILKAATFRDTYQQVKTAYVGLTALSVQTKADTYANMYIIAMPHDEDPDLFDTISLALKLREVNFVVAQYAQLPASLVSNKSNSSTVKTGQKTAAPATPGQESILHSLLFGNG